LPEERQGEVENRFAAGSGCSGHNLEKDAGESKFEQVVSEVRELSQDFEVLEDSESGRISLIVLQADVSEGLKQGGDESLSGALNAFSEEAYGAVVE
jgi:hypothetical protein